MRLIVRVGSCLALVGAAIGGPLMLAPTSAAATVQSSAAAIVFPGPSRGTPSTQHPRGSAFVTHCNASVNSDLGKVGGTDIMTGTAVEATTGCGLAVLPIDVPSQGHFHATFGVADDDTTGQPGVARVRVLDSDGFYLYTADVTARKGSPASIDVDVSHAVAIQIDFLKSPKTFLYGARLSGTARALAPAPRPGNALPAGVTPVNMTSAVASCNAHMATATTPLTVTLVGVPTAGAVSGTGCGQVALTIPANTSGTLVMRYGADDSSASGREFLYVRALDAGGRLLRKATGVAAVGTGLQPIWVSLRGARTVQLVIDGGTNVNMDMTAVGILPGRVAPYVTPNRVQSGGSSTGGIAVDPRAFASKCNSSVGSDDTAVARAPIFGGSYLSTYGCGAASLFFCCTNAEGTFHARFGVPDSETAGKPATVTVIVKDKDDHVLRQRSYSAVGGNRGTSIDVNVHRASIISFAFGGSSGVLYDMRLTGIATISERIYPPSEPPVEVSTGVAVNPHDFTVHCNAQVATDDQRLVGATTLEGWALTGTACGEADLTLAGTAYPRRDFYARVGIDLGEPPNTVVTFRFNVLNGAGKVIRSAKVQARYGYGTQPVHLSLRNGATVQILWDSQTTSGTAVYAMTAA